MSHLTTFEVADPTTDPSGKDVKEYGARIKRLALAAGKARNPASALETLQDVVNEANSFCDRFGFKTRFELPGNIEELREKAKASAARERKAEAARQVKFEREAAETVQRWLAGESVQVPYQLGKTYLRATDVPAEAQTEPGADYRTMETSKGASVPLTEAEKAFRFAVLMRERGCKFQVGDYQLDAVNAQGIVAGCHRFDWQEIERFAKLQGWA